MFKKLVSNRREWVEKQTPVGIWKSSDGDATVMLKFEERDETSKAGLYHKYTESSDGLSKEASSCTININDLRMLIFTTEGPIKKTLGVEQVFYIRYTKPNEIKIDENSYECVYETISDWPYEKIS